MITLLDTYKWNTSPVAYCTVQYEYRRSGSAMQYRFYWKVWLNSSSSYYYDGLRLTFILDSTNALNVTVKNADSTVKGWSYNGTTDWITVANKTSGTTSLTITMFNTNTNTQKLYSTQTLYVVGAPSVLGALADFDVDGSLKISITKVSSTVTDALDIYCGSTIVKQVANISNGATITFSSAEKNTIYGLMKNTTLMTFTFHLESFEANEFVGSSEVSAVGYISNAYPTFDQSAISFYDDDDATIAVTKNNQIIVQNKSKLIVNLPQATGNKGASISRYTITIGTDLKTASASGEIDFGKVSGSGNMTMVVKVVDSRGLERQVTKAITVVEYKSPTITANLGRKNNYEDETHLTVNALYSSVNGKNTIALSYVYAKVGEAFGGEIGIANNTAYTLSCNKSNAYNFRITAKDSFETITKDFVLSKGEFPLFIDIEKNAVGINAFPSADEALRVGNGVARFEDGIVLMSPSGKSFLIGVNDSGVITATEYNA